jgi:hypothetical protein
MIKNFFNYNDNIKEHLLFLSWLLHEKSEHKRGKINFFLFLRKFLNFDIFLHELEYKINCNDDFIEILFNDNTIIIYLTKENIKIFYDNEELYITYNNLYQFIYNDIYLHINGYEGKLILRTFVNQSKLFADFIYDKSLKSIKGREKFLKKYKKLDGFAVEILKKAGEILEYDKILSQHNYAYGSVFFKHSLDIFNLKFQAVKRQQPKIITIGSSRMHFFKQKFFQQKFYNCSYCMTYLEEGFEFIKNIKNSNVEIIIMGVEFWWFNPNHYIKSPFLPLHNGRYNFDIDYLNKFYEYYYDNLISDKKIKNILNKKLTNEYTTLTNIGLRAIDNSEGYQDDGYYLYNYALTKYNNKYRTKKMCLDYIKTQRFHFEPSFYIDKEKFNLFLKIIDFCHINNINLILILPPIEKELYKRLKYPDYEYIKKLRKKLKKLDIKVFDFLNPKSLSLNKKEFYDCYHGGDVVSMRILKKLYNFGILKKYINYDYIQKSIKINKNRILEKDIRYKKGNN